MKCYHDFLVQSQGMDENLSPPVEVAVNRNNISVMEKAILEVHKMEPNSVYGRIHKSPYRGIMHDGITKYSTELNGVYLRGIDENFNPFTGPYCLTKVPGGLDGYMV